MPTLGSLDASFISVHFMAVSLVKEIRYAVVHSSTNPIPCVATPIMKKGGRFC